MARDCEQLLSIPLDEPPAEKSGLDLLLVRSRLKFPRQADEPAEVASFSCVLINMGKQPGARRQLLMLEALLQGVEVRHAWSIKPASLHEVAESLLGSDDDFQVVVLALDESCIDVDSAQRVLTALRPPNTDTMKLAVVVAARPEAWSGMHDVDGFVAASDGEIARAAAQVFQALCSMSAPTLWTCLDAEDILPALGTSTSPSQVVELAWLEDQDVLAVHSESDAELLRRSSRSAAFLFVQSDGGRATRRLTEALEEVTPGRAYQARQFVVGFLARPRGPMNTFPVIVLCRD